MNCREAESLLLAERDGGLSAPQRADLAQHVTSCPACRQLRADLTVAMSAVRSEAARVRVPDIEQEWQSLRTKLRATRGAPAKRRPLAPVIWFGAPLAAAAALALGYFSLRPPPRQVEIAPPLADLARADFVEVADADASTMVYVDKDSGWLVVWAVDEAAGTE
jgi:anti-sigma factor RsiW